MSTSAISSSSSTSLVSQGEKRPTRNPFKALFNALFKREASQPQSINAAVPVAPSFSQIPNDDLGAQYLVLVSRAVDEAVSAAAASAPGDVRSQREAKGSAAMLTLARYGVLYPV